MTEIPYLDQLRRDLLTGIERRRRRIARWRTAALVAAPTALAAVIIAGTVPGGSSSALAIERDGEWIQLHITDVAASDSQMERELHNAGIDAQIRLVPVTPPLVGQWACIAELADGDPAGNDPDGPGPLGREYRVRLNEVRYTPDTLSIRRDFAQTTQDGRLVFIAGRSPATGERAATSPCRDLVPPPPR